MKKLLFAVLLAVLGSSAFAEDLQVIVSGKHFGEVYAYRVGERRYLDAKRAVEAYGGRFYWYPVAGKVQLSVRGRQAQLLVDSEKARVGDKTVELPEKVIVRANTVLVPLEFFLSGPFSEMTGTTTQFNEGTGLLTVDQRSSVGPLRWFSYKDHTRVVLELDSKLKYSLARKGRNTLDITIPLGTIDWSENAEINDGIVDRLVLRQESKLAPLALQLDPDKSPAWDARIFANPQRLVIDVYPDEETMALAKAGRKAAPPAETSVPPDAAASGSNQPEVTRTAAAGQFARGTAGSAMAPAAAAMPGAVAAAAAAAAVPKPHVPPAVDAAPAAIPGPAAPPAGFRLAKRRIVIDPGHGGKDSGAKGRRGTQEKDLNLLAAKELAKLLEEEDAFEVLLTREDDTFIPLADRSKMANDYNADLFISIHCNASHRRSESGFEIYFLSERASDPEAERVAEMENASLALEDGVGKGEDADAALLLHALAKTEFINEASELAGLMAKSLAKRVSLENRGVKQAAFYVLRGTNAPAVLVEMGFLTNSAEEAKLESKKFRRKLIEGLYAGLVDFAKRQEWVLSSASK